jgi:DNA polymerase V
METKTQKKQRIISTRSFGQRITTLEALQQSISQYTARACKKLRDQDDLVKSISVFIETNRYQENYYAPSMKLQLPYPTNDTRVITTAAKHAVALMFQNERRYVRAGIGLLEIVSLAPEQLDFLRQNQSAKSRELMRVVDQINHRSGSGAAFFLSQGIKPKWKMQRNMKSPSYTTCWQDLPRICV